MKNVWEVVSTDKNYWTEEGQQQIEQLAVIIEKVARTLDQEELDMLYAGIDEGMLYPIMDLLAYYLKNRL